MVSHIKELLIVCQMCVVIFTDSDRDLNIIHRNLQSVSFPCTSPFNLKTVRDRLKYGLQI